MEVRILPGAFYGLSVMRPDETTDNADFDLGELEQCTATLKRLAASADRCLGARSKEQGVAEEQGADFPLLSDPSKATARAYGVLSAMGYAKRHTFYIGADGTILAVDRAVKPATSAEDMARTLGELGIPPAAD